VDSIFACFYLTGQLKSILQKFQLAGVVLVVLDPHVFNLTGQLESKPPEFPTLAVTDQDRSIQKCIKTNQFPIGGSAGFFPKKCQQSVRLLLV
jgi:hypothetical protein